MNDDALIREWKAGEGAARPSVRDAVDAALAKDRMEDERERTLQRLCLVCVAVLWPILLWCAAHGVAPVVRGAYAMMAAGMALFLFAAFAYSLWDRKARPGATDALTQMGISIALLRQQAALGRWAPVWCAPIFLGAGMLGWWIYWQRNRGGGIALWLVVAAAWAFSALGAARKARELDARRSRLQQVLEDLRS